MFRNNLCLRNFGDHLSSCLNRCKRMFGSSFLLRDSALAELARTSGIDTVGSRSVFSGFIFGDSLLKLHRFRNSVILASRTVFMERQNRSFRLMLRCHCWLNRFCRVESARTTAVCRLSISLIASASSLTIIAVSPALTAAIVRVARGLAMSRKRLAGKSRSAVPTDQRLDLRRRLGDH